MCPFFIILAFYLIPHTSTSTSNAKNLQICNTHCDGMDASQVSDDARVVATSIINGREIRLIISDTDNMGFALIVNGSAGDEVWLDRSFDASLTWDDGSLLGFATIPSGVNYATTTMFNVDHDAVRGLGALRACGRGLEPAPGPLTCTGAQLMIFIPCLEIIS